MTIADITTVVGEPAPDGAIDLDLWGWGVALAERQQPDPVAASRCMNASCDGSEVFPCTGRRTAQRLMDVSRGSWSHRWTARLDALSCGLKRLNGGLQARQPATGEAPDDGERSRTDAGRGHLAVSSPDPYQSGCLPAEAWRQ
jgi:hypothetical protein